MQKNSQAVKTGVALKSLGKKCCEIKGGGQEMVTKIILNLKIFLAISWPPPLISQLFHPGFKGCTSFYSLAVFA